MDSRSSSLRHQASKNARDALPPLTDHERQVLIKCIDTQQSIILKSLFAGCPLGWLCEISLARLFRRKVNLSSAAVQVMVWPCITCFAGNYIAKAKTNDIINTELAPGPSPTVKLYRSDPLLMLELSKAFRDVYPRQEDRDRVTSEVRNLIEKRMPQGRFERNQEPQTSFSDSPEGFESIDEANTQQIETRYPKKKPTKWDELRQQIPPSHRDPIIRRQAELGISQSDNNSNGHDRPPRTNKYGDVMD